ncbi:MAG TPA: flagellin [bacterium]|nr:flagellin [bacterium]HOL48744.1 flagellin [bacterium]HPQ19256.1 flagellin [bacterium]
MRIMNNIEAIFAARQLTLTNLKLNKSLEKLSSGYRINSAADDAAGLAISERFRSQINGLEQAQKNVQDGISLIQTAEGGLEELHTILQRMRVLAVQASNQTLTTSDRQLIQLEISQLLSEIDRMRSTVEFNGINLISGLPSTGAGSIILQVGADNGQGLVLNINTMSLAGLGISGLSLTSVTGATSSLGLLDVAINKVSSQRAVLGAMQNRMEHTFNFLGIQRENVMASESRIRDVDFAQEMIEFTKLQILAQAGNAMLAQANLRPQSVLQLFS